MTTPAYEVFSLDEALELPYTRGWTDGLPTIPPTPERVAAFLEAAGLEPDAVVATLPERNCAITANAVAINAVLAGCHPAFACICLAAVRAVADPAFKFNHLASLASPWPFLIVSGPLANGVHSGQYLFGSGTRSNLAIARALSLLLQNCAGARVGGVQRGQWGNALRLSGCIAEQNIDGWDQLNVRRGHRSDQSVVTALSAYPGTPSPVTVAPLDDDPEGMLKLVCHAIANWGGSQWTRGTYVLMVGPHHARTFIDHHWTQTRISEYILEHTVASVADLKRRGIWGRFGPSATARGDVTPDDREHLVALFQEDAETDQHLFAAPARVGRKSEILTIVAGGDTGSRFELIVPYQISSDPVTALVSAEDGRHATACSDHSSDA
jgi:hypothetical protein